jgi:hypothetical protein
MLENNLGTISETVMMPFSEIVTDQEMKAGQK